MLACTRLWRRVFARALYIATSLTATPALGCPGLTVDQLAAKLPAADRFEFAATQLLPFLVLWEQQSGTALPSVPDDVALFATHGRQLLIAFRQAGCLLGLLPTPPSALWRALRLHIGPIA